MFKFLLYTFVIILILTPLTVSVSINKFDLNTFDRRQNADNICYIKSKPARRSTTLVLINQSGTDIFYVSSSLADGIWTVGCDPSTIKTIPNGQSLSFANESNGGGDEGSVVYEIGEVTPPVSFTIHWVNPLVGGNKYEVNLPTDSKYTYKAPFPPNGDNAYYEITIL